MEELLEKDFIIEKNGMSPVRLWFWMAFFLTLILLLWAATQWVSLETRQFVKKSPFLQVTNREYSLFLWHHTEHMRPNRKEKTGYLPGFRPAPNVTPFGEKADEWVTAPPELLFEYHAWKRLLGKETFRRVITPTEFQQFLVVAEEWHPAFWKKAPLEYRKLIDMMDSIKERDLWPSLPKDVRQAFLGWKNYFVEGERINAFKPTWANLEKLLEKHPCYARHYWRNVYPDYLKGMGEEKDKGEEIPLDEISSFLRVALYNFYSF